jgi:hypothetical protein
VIESKHQKKKKKMKKMKATKTAAVKRRPAAKSHPYKPPLTSEQKEFLFWFHRASNASWSVVEALYNIRFNRNVGPEGPGWIFRSELRRRFALPKRKRKCGDDQSDGIRYRWMDLVLNASDLTTYLNVDFYEKHRFNLLLLDGEVPSQSEIQQVDPPRLEPEPQLIDEQCEDGYTSNSSNGYGPDFHTSEASPGICHDTSFTTANQSVMNVTQGQLDLSTVTTNQSVMNVTQGQLDLSTVTANQSVMNVTQGQLDLSTVTANQSVMNVIQGLLNLSTATAAANQPVMLAAAAGGDNAPNLTLPQGSQDGLATSIEYLKLQFRFTSPHRMPQMIEKKRFVFYWHKQGYNFEQIADLYTYMHYKRGRAKGAKFDKLYKEAITDPDVTNGPLDYYWADKKHLEAVKQRMDLDSLGQRDFDAMDIDAQTACDN